MYIYVYIYTHTNMPGLVGLKSNSFGLVWLCVWGLRFGVRAQHCRVRGSVQRSRGTCERTRKLCGYGSNAVRAPTSLGVAGRGPPSSTSGGGFFSLR